MKTDHTVYLPDSAELNEYMQTLLGKGCEVVGELYSVKPVLHHTGILYEYSFSKNAYNAVRNNLLDEVEKGS